MLSEISLNSQRQIFLLSYMEFEMKVDRRGNEQLEEGNKRRQQRHDKTYICMRIA